jgi:hypothetical protein
VKIRTKEQLVDAIDADLSWRRRELTDIRYLIQQSTTNQTRQKVRTRAAIALLYAHWEGFVKSASETYLEFVFMQRLKNSELARSMLAIVVRSRLNSAQTSKKISAHREVVDFFCDEMEERSALPYKSAIRTESNLSSKVLCDILETLGIDASEYIPKAHLIDNQLLAKRNHIAHGNELEVGVDDYLFLHEEFTSLMNLLRNQIQNAAIEGQFLQRP